MVGAQQTQEVPHDAHTIEVQKMLQAERYHRVISRRHGKYDSAKERIRDERVIIVETSDGVLRVFPLEDTVQNRTIVQRQLANVANITRFVNDDVLAEL
jgi:hypothetical protein